jgi:hypothetical protein
MSGEYFVTLLGEDNQPIDGQVEYLVGGAPMGAAGIHKAGTALLFTDIPEGTDKFRFTSPGYSWFSTNQLYETNTITLVKEENPTKLILIGGALIGGVWLLSRFKK